MCPFNELFNDEKLSRIREISNDNRRFLPNKCLKYIVISFGHVTKPQNIKCALLIRGKRERNAIFSKNIFCTLTGWFCKIFECF